MRSSLENGSDCIRVLVVDALTGGDGSRRFTRDFIGAGPRYIAGFIEDVGEGYFCTSIVRAEDFLDEGYFSREIVPLGYRILCISAMSMDRVIVLRVLKRWHRYIGDLKECNYSLDRASLSGFLTPCLSKARSLVLLGGPITLGSSIFREFSSYVDFFIRGEGERSLYVLFHDRRDLLLDYLYGGCSSGESFSSEGFVSKRFLSFVSRFEDLSTFLFPSVSSGSSLCSFVDCDFLCGLFFSVFRYYLLHGLSDVVFSFLYSVDFSSFSLFFSRVWSFCLEDREEFFRFFRESFFSPVSSKSFSYFSSLVRSFVGVSEEEYYRLLRGSSSGHNLLEMLSLFYYIFYDILFIESDFGGDSSSWFELSSGYPDKVLDYKDYSFSRIYVDCVRGCSNFRRTGFKLRDLRQCGSDPRVSCSVCRSEKFRTVRSCPLGIPPGCGFCSTIREFGPPRSRSAGRILSEVRRLIDLGVHRIVLGGPDFLDYYRGRSFSSVDSNNDSRLLIDPCSPEPNYAALEYLIDNLLSFREVRNHTVQIFIENVKAGLCTDRALSIISRLPNVSLSIGCETGSDEFANLIGRPNSPSVTFDAIKRMLSFGIRVHVYFIHSMPGDNEKYAQETLSFLERLSHLDIEKITLYKFQLLPGSPFEYLEDHYFSFSKRDLRMFSRIKRFVINFNRSRKDRYLGRVFRVYISERNKQRSGDAIGWILEGGPKVSVIGGVRHLHSFQWVKIVRVISDRLIEGKILSHRE